MTIGYVCKRCGYTTKNRTTYSNHLNKKTICKPTLSSISREDLITELKNYISENGRSGIVGTTTGATSSGATSSGATSSGATTGEIVSEDNHYRITNMLRLLSIKEKEIERLTELNAALKTKTKDINSHNTNHITNNIELKIYGNEDFTYIVHELLNTIQSNPFGRIPQLVGLVHLNPDDPTGHHVRWVDVDKDEVLYDLNDEMQRAYDSD